MTVYPSALAARTTEQAELLAYGLRVVRTPWRHRCIVWPGRWFRSWPFPYLLHRWDVEDPQTGWWGGFLLRRHAVRYMRLQRAYLRGEFRW